MSAQDVIAEVLDEQIDRAMSTEILRELRKSGFVIVQLPAQTGVPERPGRDRYGFAAEGSWYAHGHTVWASNHVETVEATDEPMTPSEAMQVAGLYAAAARHAEAGERGE